MNPSDNEHDPQAAVTEVRGPGVPTQCDECGAPVEEEQRYCVVCGAHRRHVEDPMSRYLGELSARGRTSRTAAVVRTGRRAPARGRGLGLAVALALVPVAAAVGVVAERSSSNGDAKLIRALAREQSAADAASAAGGGEKSAAGTGGAAASADAGSGAHRRHTAGGHAHAGQATRHARAQTKAKASSDNSGGVAISTNPPTQAQKQEGAKETQKVQKSTGKSYVNSQNGLGSTVVVP